MALTPSEHRSAHNTPRPSISIVASDIRLGNQDLVLKGLLLFPLGALFILAVHFEGYSNVSRAILIFYCYFETIWALIMLYGIFSSKNLRFFRTLNGYFHNYGNISLTYGIKEYPNRAVTSLSALHAIQGSLFNLCCNVTTWVALLSTTIILLLNWHQIKSNSNNGEISGYFLFFGQFGKTMAMVFELNEKNVTVQILHYVGAALYMLCFFSYCLLTNWSFLSLLLLIIALVTFATWFIFLFVVSPIVNDHDHDDGIVNGNQTTQNDNHNTAINAGLNVAENISMQRSKSDEIETAIHEYTTPQLSRHVTNVDEVTAARVHKISLYFLLPEFGVSIAATLSCVLYLYTIIEK